MLSKNKPINHGNIDIITEINKPVIKLPLLRYEAIFDFYSEEPQTIIMQKDKGKPKIVCEQILRIRRWNISSESYSWMVYSSERETLKNLIVRKVIWDRSRDVEYIKENICGQKEEILKSWPSLDIQNICIDFFCAEKVATKIRELDKKIENGILLSKNISPHFEWRDIELKRLYNWGAIHSTWSTHKENKEVEIKIRELILLLNDLLDKEHKKVYSLKLNYSMPPELCKELVVGT